MANSIATKLGCGGALVALLHVFAGCSSTSEGGSNGNDTDSGSASDGGSDGPTFDAYDAGVTKCGDVDCFRCGNSTCPVGNYCQSTYAAHSATPTVKCAPVPSDCAATPTCGCLTTHGATVPNAAYCYEQPPACEDDGAGHVTLQCHFY